MLSWKLEVGMKLLSCEFSTSFGRLSFTLYPSMCLSTPTNGYYLSLHLAISFRFNVLCLGLHDNLLLSSDALESVSLPPSSSTPSPPCRPKLPINSQQRKNVIIVGKKSGRATKHNIHRTSTPTIWGNLFPIKLSLMASLLCCLCAQQNREQQIFMM